MRIIILILLSLIINPMLYAGELEGSYVKPEYLTELRFGAHSHWMHPWRAYLETAPASKFINAIGVNFDVRMDLGDNPYLIAEMLSKYGFTQARIEIGWGHVSFDDETVWNDNIKHLVSACKKFNIRPMILLNGHHGAPCPIKFFARALKSPAKKGDTSIVIDDTSGLRPEYSGICDITDYWACEAIITAIDNNTIQLSKPLPADLGEPGKEIRMAELKYKPFSIPGSDDYNQTMAGWQKYVSVIADYMTKLLETENKQDKGFDLEIWNELTFGSNFLSINNYYSPIIKDYRQDDVWADIAKATADYVDAHPSDFKGVQLCDGFSNTIPWHASSTEPPRVSALSHHPYAGIKNYPADEYKGDALNALLQIDKSAFIPAYTAVFPEYYAEALQTESFTRDMAPLITDIYGAKHGRYARSVKGKILPCNMWITEVGTAPNEIGITDVNTALKLKAKTTARYFTFFINKGVERLHLFSGCGGDHWLGIVKDSFIEYSRSNKTYPDDDSDFISPSLQAVKRITDKMKYKLDPNLKSTRNITIDQLSDTHDNYQFKGDGTPEHPNLYNRELFAFLPYQVNSKRFVIPYYIMTRDVRNSLPIEKYTVNILGIKGKGASLSVYDPINGKNMSLRVLNRGDDSLKLELNTTDYPYLLIIQEE